MSFLKQNTKRAFILAMTALSLIVIIFAYFYYKNENSAKDPRVKQARLLYEKYNTYALEGCFDKVFNLLDSVEIFYSKVDHFSESFEVGVLYNNRAALFLTMALYENTSLYYSGLNKDSLLNLSKNSVLKSISIYQDWLEKYKNLDKAQIKNKISSEYLIGLETFSSKEQKNFLENRIDEIETAQYETKRRLSVAYTNLGIIYRHKEDYEHAIEFYEKAIKLWEQNLTAENNLRILLGKPLRKRNLIQKLFPPKQNKNKS